MTARLNLQTISVGIVASSGLLLFYASTMLLLAGSWYAVVDQFEKLWPFMLPLSVGFGIQVGLYYHLKQKSRYSNSKVMAANTTASAVGMVACCTHHATDVLPFLGIPLAAGLLVKYQIPILLLGIVSNIIGIVLLLRHFPLINRLNNFSSRIFR